MKLPFSEHIFRLCLDYKLYSAAINLQSEMGLGKAYAGMLPYVYGLHALGQLSDEDFELYKNKYSVSLEDAHNNKKKSPVQILKEQSRANYCRTANKEFGNVLNQWATMKPKNRLYWVKKAQLPENANVKNAKLILELAEQELNAVEG